MAATSQNSLPPFGKYASWAFSASIITGIVAIIGSLTAGHGDVAGTIVTLILNPFCWLAGWFWFKSTKITCPHCGAGVPLTAHLQSQPVGSILRCTGCRNDFRKPAMSGQSVSPAEPVRVQPVPVRPAEPAIHEVPRSAGVEVLVPSVRVVEHKPKPVAADPEPADDGSDSMLPIVARTTHEKADSEPDPVILRVDGTSSFLTLKEHQRRGWKEAARCDLSSMNFRGVSFAGANLEGAKLDGSDFSGCSFRNAILTRVSAQHCDFEGADFTGAKLLNADFQDSTLKKARFCSVTGADVVAAEIDQVNFGRCNMSEAVFVPVPPKGSHITGRLRASEAVFSGSDMSRCDLQGMDFHTCRFIDTSLFGASLQRCNFEGVDLGSANLINANLSQVLVSDSTKFPEGFPLPPDAKNMDVIRRQQQAQEDARRKSDRVMFIVIAICFFGLITGVTVMIAMSETPPAQKKGIQTTAPVPETGAINPVTPEVVLSDSRSTTQAPKTRASVRNENVRLISRGTEELIAPGPESLLLSGTWETTNGHVFQLSESGDTISLRLLKSPTMSSGTGILKRSGKSLSGTLTGTFYSGPSGTKTSTFEGEVVSKKRIDYVVEVLTYSDGSKTAEREATNRSMYRVATRP